MCDTFSVKKERTKTNNPLPNKVILQNLRREKELLR